MMKFSIFTGLGALAVVGLLAGIKIMQFGYMGEVGASFVQPPSIVNSAVVTEDSWEETIYAPGELEAYKGVTISAQLDGNVANIEFSPGAQVKKGDPILKQDISSEKTQLASAVAAASLASKNLERAKPLLASKDISQEDFDVFLAEYEQAAAQVKNVQSMIDKRTIVAPFDGYLGITNVDVGQYLRPGDEIVTLQDISSILVNFSLPQRQISKVRVGQSVRVSLDRHADSSVEGTVIAISPEIDARTRNVQLQARVPNSEEFLKPGMFVDVELIVSEGELVNMIPISSVLSAPYGDTVFVITDSEGGDPEVKQIRQTFVRLGRSQGDFVSVVEGLKQGDKVVSSGLFKLFNGQNVVEDNSSSPEFNLDPQLKDS